MLHICRVDDVMKIFIVSVYLVCLFIDPREESLQVALQIGRRQNVLQTNASMLASHITELV